MTWLVIGIAIFFGIHLVPLSGTWRQVLVDRLGENRYKALFSILAGIGLAAVVWGKSQAEFVPVYDAPAWGRHVTYLCVLIAFVLLVSFHLKGRLKLFLRHPFLIAIILWSAGHLFANGDLASIVLFGGFLVYALVDLVVVLGKQNSPEFQPKLVHDVIAVAAGASLYAVIFSVHGFLFGVSVV